MCFGPLYWCQYLYLTSECDCCVRRLCRSAHEGTLIPCGFTQPSDASSKDVSLWVPSSLDHHTMKADVATYLVKLVSDVFCSIVQEERQAVSWNKPDSMEFLSYGTGIIFFPLIIYVLFVLFVCCLTQSFSLHQCTYICVLVYYVKFLFSTRCNIYISRLCYDVSVRLSVRQFVCL